MANHEKEAKQTRRMTYIVDAQWVRIIFDDGQKYGKFGPQEFDEAAYEKAVGETLGRVMQQHYEQMRNGAALRDVIRDMFRQGAGGEYVVKLAREEWEKWEADRRPKAEPAPAGPPPAKPKPPANWPPKPVAAK